MRLKELRRLVAEVERRLRGVGARDAESPEAIARWMIGRERRAYVRGHNDAVRDRKLADALRARKP